MTELVKGSTELSNNSAVGYAASLLRHYSFEMDEFTVEQLLAYWLETYPVNWVRLAVIEALYQGRYKAVSVEQILVLWKRRGQPRYHFNHEFERLVCDKFPRNLLSPVDAQPERTKRVPSGRILEPAKVGPFQYQALFQQVLSQPPSPSLSRQDTPQLLSEQAHSPAPLNQDLPEINPPEMVTSVENEKVGNEKAGNEKAGNEKAENERAQEIERGVEEFIKEPPDPIEVAKISPVSIPVSISELQGQPPQEIKGTIAELPLLQQGTPPQQRYSDSSSPTDEAQPAVDGEAEFNLPDPETIAGLPGLESASSRQLSVLLFTIEHILPGLSLTAPSLKPKLKLQLTTLYQPRWSMGDGSHHPIHQFTPATESSEFHSKLRSVAQPTKNP
ncbi:MAG: hypothetical protein WCA35_01155 [Kovacikia sp.]